MLTSSGGCDLPLGECLPLLVGGCNLPMGKEGLPLVVGECDLSIEEGVFTSSSG